MEIALGVIVIVALVFGPWILILVLFNRVSELRTRLDRMERSSAMPPFQASMQRAIQSIPEVQHPIDEELQEHAAAPAPTPVVPPPPPPKPAARPSRTREEMEMLVGGTWLARIGAVAVLIGSLFFLKYAFDNGWISEWMRVAIGAVAGTILILAGERWHRKGLKVFSQALTGAGVPILYLSVYASYGFYHLVDQPIAFGAMCVVTVIAVALSLRYASIFMALMGAIGGMCTPMWLSTGSMNTVGLFAYITLLDAGLLVLALRKPRWMVIAAVSFIGTWLWWALWLSVRSDMPDPDVFSGTVLAALFMLLGLAYSYAAERGHADDLQELRRIIGIGHAAVMYAIVIGALNTDTAWKNEIAAACMAGAFVVVSLLHRRDKNVPGTTLYSILGIVALGVGAAFEDDAYARSIVWALIGMISAVVLRRDRQLMTFVVSVGMIALATFVAVVDERSIGFTTTSFALLANLRFGALMVCALSMIVSTRVISPMVSGGWNTVFGVLRTTAYLSVILAIHREVFELAADHDVARGHSIAAAASVVLASLALLFSTRLRDVGAVYAGFVAMIVGAGWWLVHSSAVPDPSTIRPFVNVRALTGIIMLIAIAPVVLRQAFNAPYVTSITRRTISGITLIVVSFALCTIEFTWAETITIDALQGSGDSDAIADAWNRFHLIMSGTWIGYSILLMVLGFVRRLRAVRIGSLVLLLVTILKVFLYDLSFLQQPYRIVSFIALGVILLFAGYLYTRFKHIITSPPSEP